MGERCDASRKPIIPPIDASDPVKCAAAKGTWEGPPDPILEPRHADSAPRNQVCSMEGRGHLVCRGCTSLPTRDAAKACRYDWDCEGSCESGACSARHDVRAELGCRARCVEGEVKSVCVD